MAVWWYVKTGNTGVEKKDQQGNEHTVGDRWEKFLTRELMALDWLEDIEDLRNFPNKTALKKAVEEVCPTSYPKKRVDRCVTELWELKAEVKDGDIVVAVNGMHNVCGYGVVIGDYQYCKEDNDYRHTRKVSWTEILTQFDGNFSTFGCLYELEGPMREKVEKLLGINFEEIMKNFVADEIKGKINNLLDKNKNIILQGPPGTGKTHLAREIAREFVSGKSISEYEKLPETEKEKIEKEQIGFVQFHPSYDYTDFVEGLRPVMEGDDTVGFKLKSGIFKNFIGKAKDAYKKAEEKSKAPKKYVFIIDEINRGDISKIFGELFFSIDPGYRGKDGSVILQYQNLDKKTNKNEKKEASKDENQDLPKIEDENFYIPKNVYIIGTMNNIDRSVDTFDFAMRRRFCFIKVSAEESQKMMLSNPKTINRMDNLNKEIGEHPELGENYKIGATYFLALDEGNEDSESLWKYRLEPLLQEYVRGLPNEQGLVDDFHKAYNKGNAGVNPTEDKNAEGESTEDEHIEANPTEDEHIEGEQPK